MTTTLNASTSSGFVMTPDNSGVIALQNNGTTGFTLDASGRPLTPLRPAFLAIKNDTTISTGTVIYPSTQNNTGSCYDTSTGRFTAPVAGTYSFTFSVLSGTNATVYRYTIKKNGSNFVVSGVNDDWSQIRLDCNTNIDYLQGTKTYNIYLSAGDYVTIYYQADDGSNLSTASWMYFSGFLIG